ncbi:fumarylacetoacetate hydrolase family protein [Colwellia sp. E2M01]|uniref:fumarylacetoacetate hydrolase family protein n=1 Tax=Colwellia sp. E2M01 TaxID=2841561 RepID=UPI001C07FDDB|nr:fumarylacetoacetate hydrolase family protein [Colwellia sp. E2M01]MBU2871793.1 fumarylacetoacetate hydrolase family protein [Colwellia sp. E2M01]
MQSITLISAEQKTQQLTPSKVICIGRNYVEHIKELDNEVPEQMVVFLKPNSAISNTLNAEHNSDTLHYEAELCFLYQSGKFSAVALGLDLTKRDVQSKLKAKGLPWERAKAFDGSAVFSDFVSLDNVEQSALTLSLSINDKLIQQGGVSLMMFKPDEILADLQSFLTLTDGDIVMTGTPKGVGVIAAGDNYTGQVYLHKADSSASDNVLVNCQWQAQ